MASHPKVPNEVATKTAERRLSADEGWELIFRSFGTAKDTYAEYGGGEAWLLAERAAWTKDPKA